MQLKKIPGRSKRVRSPAHLAWVRSHFCVVDDCVAMPIEAAHVRTRTDGGTGMKPGDNWAVPLCREHHTEQHQIGEPAFERKYKLDMKDCAQSFASKSPHKGKLVPR